ncbi:hypothetical protein DPMN_097161 [Dreissena polymorpha]|uniref:Uncharacterized protein n=1 Tax=Dreissena polymorpha TaxID=45954 RepID=A0A9D4LAL6_DREPO|nr:hypothetical protein DPMN_097161 [Dreissena polymorpha]
MLAISLLAGCSEDSHQASGGREQMSVSREEQGHTSHDGRPAGEHGDLQGPCTERSLH